jgi:prevent-host-death family protein
MTEHISSTDAARHLGDLLARVKHRGDRFVLTRNNKPVAELHGLKKRRRGTLRELAAALKELPHDPTFAADLETVNQTDRPPSNPWDS